MNSRESSSRTFRCPVDPQRSSGTLLVGRKKLAIKVVEVSAEGFTVTVPQHLSDKLRHDRKWTLVMPQEKTIVHPEWMFNAANGDTQLGLRRLLDVTPVEEPRRSWFGSRRRQPGGPSAAPGIALGGMIMLIIAIVTLPGVGDDLGTAPKLRSALRSAFIDVSSTLVQMWR